MFYYHLKFLARSIQRNLGISFINVFGLSIGIACASLAFIVYRYEHSFDRFHEEADNIYMLRSVVNDAFNLSSTPDALAHSMEENFPEVNESMRLRSGEIVVASGQELFKEEAHFVDPNFFEFFNFELIAGDPIKVFAEPNALVLSEKLAIQYFGRKNPLGSDLTIYYKGEKRAAKITGVAKEAPVNSSVQFDFLFPLSAAYLDPTFVYDENWNSFNVTSLIRLRAKEDYEAVATKLPELIQSKLTDEEDGSNPFSFFMNPFTDYHLHSIMSANELTTRAERSYLNILVIIALLILLVACLNFTNLSNARGSQRLKEVGVRQVLGAERQQLRVQFLLESIFVSGFSVLVAVGLIHLMSNFAESYFNYPFPINWTDPVVLISLVAIALGTGLLAGIYPAILLSKLKTTETFRSDFRLGGNNMVTKVGLVFQFALSIGLLTCTLIMAKQQAFMAEQNLGFSQEEIIVVETQVQNKDGVNSEQLLQRFKEETENKSGVLDVSGVSYSFTRGNSGRMVEEDAGFAGFVFDYRIDPTYIDLLEIELLEGRNFSSTTQVDKGKTVIVNETFKERFIEGPIASHQLSEAFGDLANAKVIGVVKDYNFLDLRTTINPMVLHMSPDPSFHHFLVKVRPENISQTIAQLKTAWKTIKPDKPFEYSFLDSDLQQQYIVEARWNRIISLATGLAIIIALMGLFGLVALSLIERTKEIGIRKVLGASISDIISLFSKDFLKLVLIALIIATPFAWYYMDKWLDNYAYSIDLSWWIFLLGGLFTALLVLLMISFQSIRAAIMNPVKALRNE